MPHLEVDIWKDLIEGSRGERLMDKLQKSVAERFGVAPKHVSIILRPYDNKNVSMETPVMMKIFGYDIAERTANMENILGCVVGDVRNYFDRQPVNADLSDGHVLLLETGENYVSAFFIGIAQHCWASA